MDLPRGNVLLLVLNLFIILVFPSMATANVVFSIKHKFGSYKNVNFTRKSMLTSLKEHDAHRHRRMLSAIDFQLGGNGLPTGTSLYYTKLSIGTPAKDYFVQMDTGSDDLWINCVGCEGCPTKSDLGIKLTRYDLSGSSTGNTVSCNEDFCNNAFSSRQGRDSDCLVGSQCGYVITYGDGSKTYGDYVKDNFGFEKISGDFQTSGMEGRLAFGCSMKQFGDLSSFALDGIVGFGQGHSSILSQLAASGKSRKVFSHCLDSVEGGGIFAIGEVVEPKVITTPLVPDMSHYNAFLERIEVGGSSIFVANKLTYDGKYGGETGVGGSSGTPAIIDSGTTLAYFPIDIYDSLMSKLLAYQPGLRTYTLDQVFQCVSYDKDVDDGFPIVSFHFANSAILKAYPHDYLFKYNDLYCFGWQNKGVQTSDGRELTLLGDLVLSNKLIVYDVEKQTIGWTEYNCSSSIKVKDEQTGKVRSVAAHDISLSTCLQNGMFLSFFLLTVVLCNLIV